VSELEKGRRGRKKEKKRKGGDWRGTLGQLYVK